MAGGEQAAAAITITGLVTGVGYRYFTERRARALGLAGYVRNVGDEVEVFAEGAKEHIQELIDQLKQGPAGASVSDVHVSWRQAAGRYSEFSIDATRGSGQLR